MRILRTAALTLAALVLCGTGTAAAAGSASRTGPASAQAATSGITPATCTGTLDVTLSFTQPSYTPDQAPTVNVTAVNCTSQTLSTHLMPYGQFVDATGGRGAGCPVIDPLWNPVTIAPNATYTTSFSYTHVSGCQATQFIAYDNFYDANGALLVAGTASVPIVSPYACHVAYTNQGEWQGGFNGSISITNTGQVADNGWKLTFRFGGDQKITSVWGAGVTQNAQSVTLTNLPWDATIAPGATMNYVGFTGTWSTSDAAPSGFAVNGVTCS